MKTGPLPFILTVLVILLSSCALAADVEFNTAGAMDIPATQGGDFDGWGTHFLTRWENNTGEDVAVEEFGWPCGGFWATFWYVWITDTLPGPPGSQDFRGTFLAASTDDTEYPPSLYTYIDVSAEGIVIPANSTMYFAYGNPGMGGQITTNGVETWSYYEGVWESDTGYNRTAVMQFKGNFTAPSSVESDNPHLALVPVARPNPFNPRTSISFDLTLASRVDLTIHDLRGRLIKTLAQTHLAEGHHELIWNGVDGGGQAVGSGTYFVRLVTNEGMRQSKITLVR